MDGRTDGQVNARRDDGQMVRRGRIFFGPTFDLENFPTSGVKGRVLLEATHPVDHLLLQLRSSILESHKATTRTVLLNR